VTSLLPSPADNSVRGVKAATWLFTVFAVISAIRSCIHLLAPDGGAGTIAGMDLTVPGADGIIFAFALWGSAQLIYALIQLIVAFRYRSLVPLMNLANRGNASENAGWPHETGSFLAPATRRNRQLHRSSDRDPDANSDFAEFAF
jgi:hypothetical protein